MNVNLQRLLSILCFSLVVLAAQAEIKAVTYKGIRYAVDTENQVAEVMRQTNEIKGDLVIPETIRYKSSGKYVTCTVVSIAPEAFAGFKGLKSVYIPATVQWIGDYAFAYCKKLRHARFGSSLGARASKENWFVGTKKLEIESVLMPGESISL